MKKSIVINIGSLIKEVTLKGKFSKKNQNKIKRQVEKTLLNTINKV